MKKTLQTIPFFIPAIPVFFVLHGYRENLGYIHPRDAILLAGIYVLASLLTFGIFYLIYRHATKAALAAGLILGFYFFFGALHDFLKAHCHAVSRYAIVLPAFLVTATVWFVWLRRTRRVLSPLVFYLNLLFLIYLVIDGTAVGMPLHRRAAIGGEARAPHDSIQLTPYTGGVKPDIYFLVFDAYSSSLALRDYYHFDNGDFDRFLTSRGFHILPASMSNYKYTILSIPSIL
ncbi:MAG TPA: hypothetical protein VKU83_12565, partial [Puia sp.]|nr:hypothetical protein [Puia sp.]